ncbi:MAG: thioredoxin domain-containing protein [Pseudomonadota bacterium]
MAAENRSLRALSRRRAVLAGGMTLAALMASARSSADTATSEASAPTEPPFSEAANASFQAATSAAKGVARKPGDPRVYGVLFYADWCPKCKVLKPELERARLEDQLDNEDVLFVRLDLTDKTTSHQAKLMASALGLEDFYVENEGRTGFMLLIDPNSGQAIDRQTKELTAEEISRRIDMALKKLI